MEQYLTEQIKLQRRLETLLLEDDSMASTKWTNKDSIPQVHVIEHESGIVTVVLAKLYIDNIRVLNTNKSITLMFIPNNSIINDLCNLISIIIPEDVKISTESIPVTTNRKERGYQIVNTTKPIRLVYKDTNVKLIDTIDTVDTNFTTFSGYVNLEINSTITDYDERVLYINYKDALPDMGCVIKLELYDDERMDYINLEASKLRVGYTIEPPEYEEVPKSSKVISTKSKKH